MKKRGYLLLTKETRQYNIEFHEISQAFERKGVCMFKRRWVLFFKPNGSSRLF